MEKYDLTRIKNLMRRAQAGEELTIGFLGGSITQGSLATEHKNTYAYRVFTWWKETFPKAEFHYVNGGIGGTTSHFGVARAVSDVLMYQPDFVVIDFSVNDKPNDFFKETYEGVLLKVLTWTSEPAVVLLNNVYYDTGINAQEQHVAVGDWYQIPHVSIKDTLYQEMKAGAYTREELTPDGLHPNDKGHGLVAAEIIKFLEEVKNSLDAEPEGKTGVFSENLGTEIKEASAGRTEFPKPLTGNAYEYAQRLTIREIFPKLQGFRADTEEKQGHLDCFKNGWIGKNPKDKITFEVEASCIAVQYRKTIKRPAVKALLILDENVKNPILLDSNFDEDWGDCLYLQPILHHGIHKKHKVEIIVQDTDTKDKTPFYLMSLIIA